MFKLHQSLFIPFLGLQFANGYMDTHVLKRDKSAPYALACEALLDKWLEAYEERLKPSFHLGDYRFANREDLFHWNTLSLEANNTVWVGEPAGDIYTDYLKPETLTLYTNESKADLMKKYRLVPDREGNVKIYERFCKNTISHKLGTRWERKKGVVSPLIHLLVLGLTTEICFQFQHVIAHLAVKHLSILLGCPTTFMSEHFAYRFDGYVDDNAETLLTRDPQVIIAMGRTKNGRIKRRR